MKRNDLKANEYRSILAQIRRYHDSMRKHLSFLSKDGADAAFFEALTAIVQEMEPHKESVEKCAASLTLLCLRYQVPFTILIEDIDIIKDEWLLVSEVERKTEIKEFFKALKNAVGYRFLLHDAQHFVPLEMGQLKEKSLYKIHYQWQMQLFEAIRYETMDDFPLRSAQTCPFKQALEYPESQMICNELHISDIMTETHEKLHEMAMTFAFLWSQEQYKAAYVLLQQIKEKSERLLNLIATLYFNAQINHDQTFKRFLVDQLSKSQKIAVGIFDIHSMKDINKLYNVKTGDMVINLVEKILQTIYRRYEYCMLFSKGSGGDFYLMFRACDESVIRDIETTFDQELTKEIESNKNLPHFSVKKAFLTLNTPIDLNVEEVSSLYSYLKEHLVHTESLFISDPKEQLQAIAWVKNHYHYLDALKERLEQGKVEIFLQPINYLRRIDKIHAYEVLVRLEHGGHFIAAGSFIDDLVAMRLVPRLDHLVLERIIHHAQRLHRIGSKYFINVSPQTLKDEAYIQKLIEAIRGPLVGMEIIVELTEQVFLENISLVTFLHETYDLIFAIDDFGTGYSSLNTVLKLAEQGALGYLKIDGSLTANFEASPSTQTILHFIRDMSLSLGLETIVECIETKEQARRLAEFDIEYGQGYYLGRPTNVLEIV